MFMFIAFALLVHISLPWPRITPCGKDENIDIHVDVRFYITDNIEDNIDIENIQEIYGYLL